MTDGLSDRYTFETWRKAVRPMLARGVKAEALRWRPSSMTAMIAAGPTQEDVRLPRSLMQLLETLALYRHEGRWELMYRLAWRSLFENPRLLEDAADADVAYAISMERAVRRDIHKMHAFVRFREIVTDGEDPAYFAWFEPQHEIVRKGAIFFVKRFPNMRWTIATPDGAVAWDLETLRFVASPAVAERPRIDPQEDLWRTYYRSICNVARINPRAMQREMPRHYWRNLPEAADIGTLVRDGGVLFAARHQEGDQEFLTAAKSVQRSLEKLPAPGEGPQVCRRCEIWQHATQAVEGEGPASAGLMLVGEQPGDEEDLRGQPFVGPAGGILNAALEDAGLDRSAIYVTNAVKHFKWEPRGKRRMHSRPGIGEINACNVWLEREIRTVKPLVIVALGASALRALSGSSLSIEAARGQVLAHPCGARILATYHPSAVLRAEGERATVIRALLVKDLKHAADIIASPSRQAPLTNTPGVS